MTIDVRLPGSPVSVRAVATWLDSVKSAITDADVDLAMFWSDSNIYWTGAAGTAWRGAVGTLRSRAMGVPSYLGDSAEVFNAYANRLERAQEDCAELRRQAGEIGLRVSGSTVFSPSTTLAYCPGPGSAQEDLDEYDRYLSLVRSYNDLGTHLGRMTGELDAWIGENIAPLVARADDFDDLAGTVSDLVSADNDDVALAVLDGYHSYLDTDLKTWRESHDAIQEQAETFQRQLRSGNPAVRAAAEAADPRAMRQGVEQMAEEISKLSKVSRAIPILGNAVEIVTLAADVADGGSLSSGVAEIVGGAAGGAGGAAAGGAIAVGLGSNPVGWVVGGTIVGGLAVGAGARWLWEAAVPLDSRETVDDFFTGTTPQLEGYRPTPRPSPGPAPTPPEDD